MPGCEEKQLCFNCLSSAHYTKQCLTKQNCYKCERFHHRLLHELLQSTKQLPRKSQPSCSSVKPADSVAGNEDSTAKIAASIGVRRRRRLAGHLFQDRWKDQSRGFILLPPWPPNCLGQMLTVRDFSQHLVSSSKTIRPNIPRGARCMGHCEMM